MLTLVRDYHRLGDGFQIEPEPLEPVDLQVDRIHGKEQTSAVG
jgi:hypothetical protein